MVEQNAQCRLARLQDTFGDVCRQIKPSFKRDVLFEFDDLILSGRYFRSRNVEIGFGIGHIPFPETHVARWHVDVPNLANAIIMNRFLSARVKSTEG